MGRRRLLKTAAIVGLVALVFVVERRYQLSALLTQERIHGWVEGAGTLGPLLFMASMALAVVVSPIPSLPLDILAGQLFGPILGTLYAAIGALLGAVISFLIARLLGRELIARFLGGHINFCRYCSDRLLTKLVLVSRLIPFVSFDVVSYGAGLTAMSVGRFSAATFVGVLPLTFVYVSYGSVLLDNRVLAWVGGSLMVILFFLVPRWIERNNLLGLRRYFQHEE
jgi:uncharacterized membrane protein YdjX (TVP38/TMEM64 family)